MFEHRTYVVLDLPNPMATQITAIRARFDAYTASLPAEITVIGSGGVGTIAAGQDPRHVFDTVDRVAVRLQPCTTRFLALQRFPNTDIFYVAPAHAQPFIAMQHALVATELRFNPNPFPYTPHCTIRAVGAVSAADVEQLATLQVPQEPFTLTILSVYELVEKECHLLHRVTLEDHT